MKYIDENINYLLRVSRSIITLGRYLKVFLLISILSPTSCINLVEDSFSPIEPIPVVNSIMVNGSPIEIYVSLATGIDTSSIPFVDNARITLYEDGEFLEVIPHMINGYYKSNFYAQERSSYSCIVSIPGFEDIYCKDSIPVKLDIEITDHTIRAGLNDEGAYHPSISFTFHDDPVSNDYYEVLIFIIQQGQNYNRAYPSSSFNESYAFLLNEGFEPYSTRTLLFNDKHIDPDLDELTLNYNMGSSISCFRGDCTQRIAEYTAVLQLRRVSEEYYNYLKHFYIYEKGRYGEIIEGVISSHQLYSNVENGMGIFAAYSTAIDSVHIDAEIIKFE